MSGPSEKKRKVADVMTAVRVHKTGGFDALSVDEKVDVPAISTSQVLVEVAYAGVNFIDTYHRTGLYPLPLPAVLGREASGVVVAAGDNVSDLKVGDRVVFFVQGCYAEYVAVEAAKCSVVPEEVSLADAAAVFLQGLTAHYLTNSTFALSDTNTCLIHAGAGGTGNLAIQMAKIRGADVYTTVSTSEKAEIAEASGADHVINYTQTDFMKEIRKSTDGRGVDVVYDGVGKSTYEGSMLSLRPRGTLVLFGNASGAVPPINPLQLSKNGSLFLTRPTLKDYIADPKERVGRANDLWKWITNKQLRVRVAKVFNLSEAAAAHKYLQGRKALGKVLLKVAGALRK